MLQNAAQLLWKLYTVSTSSTYLIQKYWLKSADWSFNQYNVPYILRNIKWIMWFHHHYTVMGKYLPRHLKNWNYSVIWIYFRALEEIFFAYNWMLQNFRSLGTNGKFIIVGGDSAGGNFSVGLTLLCLRHGIRLPDSLMLIYPALLCQMYPSPSRLMTLFDPLVTFPFLMRCLNR